MVAEKAVPLQSDNWPLEGTGLKAKYLEPFLQNRQPEKILYFRGDRFAEILPKELNENAQGTLYISNAEAVAIVKAQRQQDMASRSGASGGGGSSKKDTIGSQDYDLQHFAPGTRNDKVTTIIPVENPSFAVYGPDFSLVSDDRSPEKLKILRSRILSLGHNGEVVLKVKGTVDDGAGADFILYENVFEDMDNPGEFYQEFAHVGVATAEAPEDFVWFPCVPEKGLLKGCMGAVPTNEGGDHFDLAQIGMKKIQYIKIKDTGTNFDNRDLDTAGADLDAGSLKHGTVIK